MRLINADDFKKRLYEIAMNGGDLTYEEFYKIASALDNQPTAYDVDKVVERLKEKARGNWGYPSVMELDDVIKIVKSDGIE